MPGYGLFQPSISGMDSQSHALGVISTNIANVNTGGYKRSDTGFATLISASIATASNVSESASPLSAQSDLGGVRVEDNARISEAGDYVATGRDLDVAINGNGFLVMSANSDGSGTPVYGRDGSLSTAPGDTAGADTGAYLVDKNGYYVQGWAADANGTFPVGGALTSMRVDADAFAALSAPTTEATLALNLPSADAAGDSHSYDISFYDSAGNQRSLGLGFTKLSTANSWQLDVSGNTGDTVTVTPIVGAGGEPLSFAATGELTSPKSLQIAVTHAGTPATTSAFTLDISGLTQLAGEFTVYDYTCNGFPPGTLESIEFESDGTVTGLFDNGHSRPLYRFALADFANADGLDRLDGNVYEASENSGTAALGTAGTDGIGDMSSQTREFSNVDMAEEFTRMIATQSAYNASATAFRTLDEITETARDLIV